VAESLPEPAGATQRPLIQQPERLRARLKAVPAEPGCYLMRDADDRILYIGKAKLLRNRVRSYFQASQGHSPRIGLMVRQVCEIEFIVTDSEAEALALESNLIKQNQPHFNVLLKDDKKYPVVHHPPPPPPQPAGSFLRALCGCGTAAPHPGPRQAGVSTAATAPATASGSHLPEL
jgi:hypothetical protein